MINKRLRNLFLMAIMMLSFEAKAQNYTHQSFPEIDKTIPDYFFSDIEYFSKNQASLKDFRGKWLILDFWTRSCVNCITSFPKYNSIQKQFNDKLQILMIGYNSNSSNLEIRKLYNKMRQRQNIKLPVAWDTALFNKFKGESVPFVILIDPDGIVRAMSYELTVQNIQEFLDGKDPGVGRYQLRVHKFDSAYNSKLPLLVNGINANGGVDTQYLYRSLLTAWNESMPRGRYGFYNGTFEITNATLLNLYNIANTGKIDWDYEDRELYGVIYPLPILEVKDSSFFIVEDGLANNRYSYSLKIPNSSNVMSSRDTSFLKKDLLNVLEKMFPFTSSIETRTVPVYRLFSLKNTHNDLKTKSNRTLQNISTTGFTANNISLQTFCASILSKVPRAFELPIINDTFINYNIDINLDCNMTDIGDIRQALGRNGLDLVDSETKMKAIVIRDAKRE